MADLHLIGGASGQMSARGVEIEGLKIETAATPQALADALSRPSDPVSGASSFVQYTGATGEELTAANFAAQPTTLVLEQNEKYHIDKAGKIAPVNDNSDLRDEMLQEIENIKGNNHFIEIVANGVNRTDANFNAYITSVAAKDKEPGTKFTVKVANGGEINGTVWPTGGEYIGTVNPDNSITWGGLPDDAVQKTSVLDTTDEEKALTGKALEGISTQQGLNTTAINEQGVKIGTAESNINNLQAGERFQKHQNGYFSRYQDNGTVSEVSGAITETGSELTFATENIADGTHVLRIETGGADPISFFATVEVAGGIATIDNSLGHYEAVKSNSVAKATVQVLTEDAFDQEQYDSDLAAKQDKLIPRTVVITGAAYNQAAGTMTIADTASSQGVLKMELWASGGSSALCPLQYSADGTNIVVSLSPAANYTGYEVRFTKANF